MSIPRVVAAAALVVAAAMMLLACPPQSHPTQVPPSPVLVTPPERNPSPGGPVTPGGPGSDTPGTGSPVNPDDDTAILGAAGDPCDLPGDCESGTCEGQGCGLRQGVCAPTSRACTRDLRSYCGCEGHTFQSSGSCPQRRFAYPGACTTKKPDGAECVAAVDCASGVCAGEGCGADAPGRCQPRQQACTKDLAQYCGCDGKTFGASGSCPGQRFARRGACPAARSEGARCRVNAECDSGICEGEGCDESKLGVCAPARRACTKDRRAYCGCDGKTFHGSGSCPGRRFANRGTCQ